MATKRVLVFSLAYYPFVGGAEVALREIVERLAGDEYEFEIITVNLDGNQPAIEKYGTALVRRLGGGKLAKYLFPFTAYRLAKRLHQREPYDVVWAMMANQAGLATLFFKWQFPKVKYLLTLQEGDSLFDIWLRTWFMRPLYKAIYRCADHIQAISNFLAKRAIKFGAKCSVTVVPNGVDIDKFKVTSYKVESGERKNKIIITTSRLVKKNGISDLIKSLTYLQSEVSLWVLGIGKEEHSLRQLVCKIGVENRVKFLGQIDGSQIPEYLAKADAFVRASLSEGLGNSFLEAMATGLPVVGTPVGGIPDFLKTGQTGWLCQVNNPKSIAEQIKFIL
ncbi:MAG: glycosyltransferase family 4 protein, partial [Patescibacteria group bacterium]